MITEQLITDSFTIEWNETPWDSNIMLSPVIQITQFEIFDHPNSADFSAFEAARDRVGCKLVSCRLDCSKLAESIFLEDQGFRFIEMAYRPALSELNNFDCPHIDDIGIRPAISRDLPAILDIAGNAFINERFHVDPRIDPGLGDQRYVAWVNSSLKHESQNLFSVYLGSEIVAFFITENLPGGVCYWHLNAVSPQHQGKGIGRKAWLAMIEFAKGEGAKKIQTCVVARNIPVINLYASLGFKFLSPMMTFHWCKHLPAC